MLELCASEEYELRLVLGLLDDDDDEDAAEGEEEELVRRRKQEARLVRDSCLFQQNYHAEPKDQTDKEYMRPKGENRKKHEDKTKPREEV